MENPASKFFGKHIPSDAKFAEDLASELYSTKAQNELTPLAVKFRDIVAEREGLNKKSCLKGFTYYAQMVKHLPCMDPENDIKKAPPSIQKAFSDLLPTKAEKGASKEFSGPRTLGRRMGNPPAEAPERNVNLGGTIARAKKRQHQYGPSGSN